MRVPCERVIVFLLISITLAAPAHAYTLPATNHPCDETWIAEIMRSIGR